jgi:hypothetical protein
MIATFLYPNPPAFHSVIQGTFEVSQGTFEFTQGTFEVTQ